MCNEVSRKCFLTGENPLTAVSFTLCVNMSQAQMNLRPIKILGRDVSFPSELTAVSPSPLRGLNHYQWMGLCLARNYWGQLGVVAQQQQTFKKMWKIHYSRRLCHTHRMLQQGNCTMNDIVLIHDLSISDRQPPYPRLGRIQSFMDELKDQAIISYGEGGTNR